MTSDVDKSDGVPSLNRALRSTKIRLLLLVIFCVGVAGILLSKSTLQDEVEWIPFLALGESLLSAAIVGFVYEWFARRETDRALELLVNQSSANTARLIAEQLVRHTFLEEGGLRSFSKDEKELALRSALDAWTDNHEVAAEIATNILPQFPSKGGYWKKVRYEVQFEPDAGPDASSGRYMDVQLICEYTARLSRDRFVTHLDWGEGRLPISAIDEDTYQEYGYSAGFTEMYPLDDEDAYAVTAIEIDGRPLDLTRSVIRKPSGVATLLEIEGNLRELKQLVGREVRHRVSIKIKVPKVGHYVILPLIRSAVGVECVVRAKLPAMGINKMSLRPLLQSGGPIFPTESKSAGGDYVSRVETTRAVFAGSGLFVVWNLSEELKETFKLSDD